MTESSSLDTDIIVAGGGPAGSTAATLLARRGWRVTLLEREKFPRFQVGESLLPYNNDLFRELGIIEILDRGGFVDKRGAEFLTADGAHSRKFLFGDNLPTQYGRTYQVKRAEFDAILLQSAREAGVSVIEQARVTGADLSDRDGVSVTWLDPSGISHRTSVRFLVDATGANGRVTSSVVRRAEREALRKISFFAHFEGVGPARDGSLDITIALFRDGWAWVIPVDHQLTSLGVVMDAESWSAAGRTREQVVEAAIAGSEILRERFRGARRVSEVWARKNFSYSAAPLAGANFVLAGDAAGFIDPIFSTGVYVAMKGAETAAAAIDDRLRTGSMRQLRRYEKSLDLVLRRYLRIIEQFYRPEFLEVFLHPQPSLGISQSVVGLLAGNAFDTVRSRWKMEVFYLLVRLQRRMRVVAPAVSWDKLPSVWGERISEVNVV